MTVFGLLFFIHPASPKGTTKQVQFTGAGLQKAVPARMGPGVTNGCIGNCTDFSALRLTGHEFSKMSFMDVGLKTATEQSIVMILSNTSLVLSEFLRNTSEFMHHTSMTLSKANIHVNTCVSNTALVLSEFLRNTSEFMHHTSINHTEAAAQAGIEVVKEILSSWILICWSVYLMCFMAAWLYLTYGQSIATIRQHSFVSLGLNLILQVGKELILQVGRMERGLKK